MTSFVGSRLGRYVIIGLQRGDLILESIRRVLEENGIRSAIVTSGVAAVSRMRWHHIGTTEERPDDLMLETDGPIEVSAIGGLVLDGVPHLHCAFADHSRAWAGHLEEGCRIAYVGEITLIELLDADVSRVPNPFGVNEIREGAAAE